MEQKYSEKFLFGVCGMMTAIIIAAIVCIGRLVAKVVSSLT